MTWLRSALFALALVLVTPPYAIIALASFPLPRMARYRLITAWSRLVVWLAWVLCGVRWKIVSRSTSGAIDGPVCMPLAPVPIMATRLPATSTP